MHFLFLSLFLLAACQHSPAPRSSPVLVPALSSEERDRHERDRHEAIASHFIVAAQGDHTALIGQQILAAGGNTIDAAIAASFAISVERPHSTGLGGGGFLLFRQASSGQIFAVDFRERAPQRATEKMYLDGNGNVIEGRSTTGIHSVAVPGLVAGLLEIHKRFGSLSLQKILQPAIDLAENGFAVYPSLASALAEEKEDLAKFPATKKIFFKASGEVYGVGDILIQKDLAKTLRLISQKGRDGFYQGSVAKALVKESQARKGLLSEKDLTQYQVRWRNPVRGSFKGFEVVSFPPPSSGGTHVIEILNILEKDDLKKWGATSAEAIHLRASAMQQAFADRAKFMGDPDFVKDLPQAGLLAKSYAQDQRQKIDLKKARSAQQVSAGIPPDSESSETTHFSIMDKDGNVVVSTQTINGYFGSKLVVPGTGVLLNNEMDDFSAKPGSPNIYGAVGGAANSIQPQKTPLSSMSPTIVLKDGSPVLALGAPGGTRIITCVAQTILNYLEFKFPLYESVSAVRFHHQWQPDHLEIEDPGPGEETLQRLKEMGYKIKKGAIHCNVNAVAKEGQQLHGVADPRDVGAALGL